MKKAIVLLSVVVAAIAAVGVPIADASEWRVELDPARTKISFTLKATMHTVHGEARLVGGSLLVDTITGVASGEIIVDAATAETGNSGRDKKMHRKVLESVEHPTIVLRPVRIEGPLDGAAAADVVLVSELVLKGVAHEVDIPISLHLDGSDFTATAEFTIPYVEWGLEDPSTFVLRVAKEVQVRVTAAGTVAAGDGTQ